MSSVSSISPAQQALPAPYAGGPVAVAGGASAQNISSAHTAPAMMSQTSDRDLLNPPPPLETRIDKNVALLLQKGMMEKNTKQKVMGILGAEAIAMTALPDWAKAVYQGALQRTERTGQMPDFHRLNAFLTNDATQQAAMKKNGERLGAFTIWYLDAFFLVAKDYGAAQRAHGGVATGHVHNETPPMMMASASQQQH